MALNDTIKRIHTEVADIGSKMMTGKTIEERVKEAFTLATSNTVRISKEKFIQNMRKGHSFKDFICPDTMEFEKDYFKMGNKYGRVIFLKEYASYIKDNMVAELTDLNRNMMMSVDVIPVPMDEAVREVENRRLGVELNVKKVHSSHLNIGMLHSANNTFS